MRHFLFPHDPGRDRRAYRAVSWGHRAVSRAYRQVSRAYLAVCGSYPAVGRDDPEVGRLGPGGLSVVGRVRRPDRDGCGLNPTVGALEGTVGGDRALVRYLDRPYRRLSRDWQPPNPLVVAGGAPVETAALAVSAAASADQLVPPVETSAAEDGRWLVECFVAVRRAAEPEICLQLNRLLHRVFEQRWFRQKPSYFELRGDRFILLAHWREVGKLQVEPLGWRSASSPVTRRART
ncbi:MAG: hypothetical protein ACYDCL_21690 [Myxococcales bacterium]